MSDQLYFGSFSNAGAAFKFHDVRQRHLQEEMWIENDTISKLSASGKLSIVIAWPSRVVWDKRTKPKTLLAEE
eukprot:3743786-Amphidinium_carterae.1